jgi:DMSO/TMAO reductase YedYZ molybdopterin-dependent catalytic subunit
VESKRKTVVASPENSETPLDAVASWVTPNRLFFVRNHFEVPAINASSWELKIEGMIERPQSWTQAMLAAMPQHSVFATVECAGNGRSFLREKAAGVQWGAGAIGHAEWTGVRLRDLLDAARVKAGAVDVVFEGADRGSEADHPGPMYFSRSLPLAKALDADTIVALQMNGDWLEPNHGAPMRLFVPGWYGVASIKWLRRIRVIDHAYAGYFQTTKYSIQRASAAGRRRLPLGPGVVKSEMLHPAKDSTLGLGTNRIAGLAWGGEERIARVEISTDGGVNWYAAQVKGLQQPYSWCQWEWLWNVSRPGEYTLMCRAHTESGQTQPFEYDANNLGYLINVVIPRAVRVVADQPARAGYADDMSWIDSMEAFAENNTQHPFDLKMKFTSGDGI